jgi:hypothetical protein
MKSQHIFFFLLTISTVSVAQSSSPDLGTILTQLRQTDVFRECADFKTNIEQQTRNAAQTPGITADQRDKLRLAYTGVYEKYDAFLKAVKQDLVNPQRMQAIAANPAVEAAQYAALYAGVKAEYDGQFLPVLQSISSGGKGIIDDLKAMARTSFLNIVSQVLTSVTGRVQQQLTLNMLLPVVNERFYNPLRMKLWSELDIPPLPTTSTPTNSSGAYQPQPTPPEAVVIPAATTNSLAGSIAFVQLLNQQETSIAFEQRTGKDIAVITDSTADVVVKDQFFSSVSTYSVGTKFRANVSNNGFTYVVALNSDGVALLYPQVRYTVGKGVKDVTVIQDVAPANGTLRIPATGLFGITPSKTGVESPSEDIGFLLSKSELVIEELIEKLNAAQGNLPERITQVFGAARIPATDAGVQFINGQIVFNGSNSPQNVLPLVFRIRK